MIRSAAATRPAETSRFPRFADINRDVMKETQPPGLVLQYGLSEGYTPLVARSMKTTTQPAHMVMIFENNELFIQGGCHRRYQQCPTLKPHKFW